MGLGCVGTTNVFHPFVPFQNHLVLTREVRGRLLFHRQFHLGGGYVRYVQRVHESFGKNLNPRSSETGNIPGGYGGGGNWGYGECGDWGLCCEILLLVAIGVGGPRRGDKTSRSDKTSKKHNDFQILKIWRRSSP